MKKLNLVLLFLTITLLTSCGSEDYKCESNIAKSTVKGIHKDLLSDSRKLKKYKIEENFIVDFLKNNVELTMIRTSSISEEIKKCECQAKMIFNVESNFVETQISDNLFWENANSFEKQMLKAPIKRELKNGFDIEYTVQQTNNDEIIAETYEIEKLADIIIRYNDFKKSKSDKKVTNYKSKNNNGKNKYKLTYLKNNKIDIEYTYFDYKSNEVVELKDGEIIVNDLPSDFPIEKNKFYLIEGDVFKAFNPESQDYDLYDKI